MAALVDISNLADLQAKQDLLFCNLAAMGRLIVAFSGGTDSAYLAWAAHRVLGKDALAMTADSASLPDAIWRTLRAQSSSEHARMID